MRINKGELNQTKQYLSNVEHNLGFFVPTIILNDMRLDSISVLILSYISYYTFYGEYKAYTGSHVGLQVIGRCSKNTVKSKINQLLSLGLIEKSVNENGREVLISNINIDKKTKQQGGKNSSSFQTHKYSRKELNEIIKEVDELEI